MRKRCPRIENDETDHRNLKGNYKRFRGYALYSGHYGYDIYAAIANGHVALTNFRHPVDRLVSLFNYFKYVVQTPEKPTRPDHFYHVRLARSISFEEFVTSSDLHVQIYTRNAHFRQLTHSLWSLETHRSLDDAFALLDHMPWYYVCEHPELSTAWFRTVFGIQIPEIPRENRTPKVSTSQVDANNVSESTRSRILERNQLDVALYEYAVKRLLLIREKLNLVPSEAGGSS